MNLRWEDASDPIAQHSFSTMAGELGLALALEMLAQSREAQLCAALPRELKLQIHAFLADHRVEAGGLLLGRRFALRAAPAGSASTEHSSSVECSMISIERFVPGRVFEGTGISLALGTEVWDDARPLIDAGYAVVGWVHSHPDLGAFFSGTDRSTQRAFFAQPWQVGICIDPVRHETAWFRGKDSLDEGIVCIEF